MGHFFGLWRGDVQLERPMSEHGLTEASVGLDGLEEALWRAEGQWKHRSSLNILLEGAL